MTTATQPAVHPQGSPEWHAARCGKVTASNFAAIMQEPRSKSAPWSQSAETYARQLVCERLTGLPQDEASGKAIDWGNANEEAARQAHEERSGLEIMAAPFVTHPLVASIGASVDGLIGSARTVEIKCPWNSWRHVDVLLEQRMPPEHVAQVQGGLWITGREVCDFISYDPRQPARLRAVILPVPRDHKYVERLAERVTAFAQYVDELEERIRCQE